MMDNILETTLANKDQGPNWIRMQPNSGTTAGGDTTTVSGTAYSDSLAAGTHELTITVTTNDPYEWFILYTRYFYCKRFG